MSGRDYWSNWTHAHDAVMRRGQPEGSSGAGYLEVLQPVEPLSRMSPLIPPGTAWNGLSSSSSSANRSPARFRIHKTSEPPYNTSAATSVNLQILDFELPFSPIIGHPPTQPFNQSSIPTLNDLQPRD